jgi:hypothetical protein
LFDAYYYYGHAAFAHGQVKRSAELFRKASEVRQEDFQNAVLLAQSLRMLGLNPADGRALALGSVALY